MSRSDVDDNVPIRNSPDDDYDDTSAAGRARSTVAVLSRLRSAIMGSTEPPPKY